MELPSRNDERGIPHKPYVRRNPNQRRPRLVRRRVCRVTLQCSAAKLILADVSRLDQNLGMAGTGRAPVANTSLLMDRALALQRRADALLVRAKHPFTKDQIALVALAAADAQTWLVDAASDLVRLRDIDASLEVQARKLDDLESLLREHS